jgi:hypothetical protein
MMSNRCTRNMRGQPPPAVRSSEDRFLLPLPKDRVERAPPRSVVEIGEMLERVQIRQQIVDLLLTKNLGEAWHLVAPQANYIRHPVIIRRHAAHRQILPLENAFHAGPLPSARRVRFMTPVAIIVVNLASGDLLRIKSKFGIALAALNIAAGQQAHHRDTETQSNQFQLLNFRAAIDATAGLFHLSVEI